MRSNEGEIGALFRDIYSIAGVLYLGISTSRRTLYKKCSLLITAWSAFQRASAVIKVKHHIHEPCLVVLVQRSFFINMFAVRVKSNECRKIGVLQ